MKVVLPALVVAAALALSGCISMGGGYDSLKPGATKVRVVQVMGCPNSVARNGDYEALSYSQKMPHFFQWGPENYAFIFKSGVLVDSGVGSAQVKDAGFTIVKPVKTVEADGAAAVASAEVGAGCGRAAG